MILQLAYVSFVALFGLMSKKNSKFIKHGLLFLIVFYLILLTGFSYTNNDTGVYINYWNWSKSEFFSDDIGYGLLMDFAHKLNLSYEHFRFIIYCFSFIILHISISKLLKKNEVLFYIIYALYPLLLDNIEVRNFIAYTLFIFSLTFFNKTSKKNFFIFIFLYIVACSFHKIIIIYSIPLFFSIFFNVSKKMLFLCDVIFVILCILGIFRSLTSDFLSLLPKFIVNLRGVDRNLKVNNQMGWIISYAITISFYFSNRIMINSYVSNSSLLDNKIYKFINVSFYLSVLACFLIPFYAVSADYMRILRNVIPILTISILCLMEHVYDSRLKYSLYFLILVEFIYIIEIFYGGRQVGLIYDIYVNNYFFNLGDLKYTWETRPWNY